jgi:mono/diheme cytochrome c family protein
MGMPARARNRPDIGVLQAVAAPRRNGFDACHCTARRQKGIIPAQPKSSLEAPHDMHRSYTAALSVIAALAASVTPTLAEGEKGSADAGRVYANAACSNCHAIERGAKSSPEVNAPPFAVMINKVQLTPAQIEGWLTSSHANMPDLAVPPDKRADLVAYIESLVLKP